MKIALYDKIEHAAFFPNDQILEVASGVQGMQAYRAGKVDAFLTSDPTVGGKLPRRAIATKYVVALTPRLQSALQLSGKTVATSPDDRDVVPQVLQNGGVTTQSLTDIALLTSQQYVTNVTCVDVYITSVVANSPTLAALTTPFAVSAVQCGPVQMLHVEQFKASLNLRPINTGTKNIYLCGAV